MKNSTKLVPRWSIQTKLSLIYSVIFIVPFLVIGFLLLNRTSHALEREVSEYAAQALAQSRLEVEAYLDEMSRLALMAVSDEQLREELQKSDSSPVALQKTRQYIQPFIFNLFSFKNSPSAIYIWQATDRRVFVQSRTLFISEGFDLKNEKWFQEARYTGAYWISPPHLQAGYNSNEKPLVVTIFRPLGQVYDPVETGYVLLDVEVGTLQQLAAGKPDRPGFQLLVNNQSWQPLNDAPNQSWQNVRPEVQSWASGQNTAPFGYFALKEATQPTLIVVQTLKNLQWALVGVFPLDFLNREGREVQFLTVLAGLVGALFVIIVSVGVSFHLTRPVKELRNKMREVSRGDYSVSIQPRGSDELTELAVGFNAMIEETNHLIHNVMQSQLRAKEAELHALQSRINPHFLFNTLDTIRMKASLNKDREVAEMIEALAHLMRAAASGSTREVTLSEELEQVQNYLYIQNIRWGGRYTTRLEIEPGLESLLMPRLTLQPLVENAFQHGLEPKGRPGWLQISARAAPNEPELVLIEIEDNGIGMSDKQAQKMVAKLNAQNDFYAPDEADAKGQRGHLGIGMLNVHARLALWAGAGCGLELVSSTPGQGTRLRLRLPHRFALNSAVVEEEIAEIVKL
jgi:two-component system, sensor histidine kinase YesM